jgi:hypothetical protein
LPQPIFRMHELILPNRKERRFVDVDVDDDDELDSGDDEGGYDRHSPELTPPPENQDLQVITLDLPRHVIPEPSDNEVST